MKSGQIGSAPTSVSDLHYEAHLLRQNSLIHHGWRVFRWSDREIQERPERVKQELELFLERIPGIFSFDDFLPKQGGAVVELRLHQQEALDSLAALRASGRIALLADAQGAGKTIAAIADAKRHGGRTLFIAHRRELVEQDRQLLRGSERSPRNMRALSTEFKRLAISKVERSPWR